MTCITTFIMFMQTIHVTSSTSEAVYFACAIIPHIDAACLIKGYDGSTYVVR